MLAHSQNYFKEKVAAACHGSILVCVLVTVCQLSWHCHVKLAVVSCGIALAKTHQQLHKIVH